MTSLTRAPRRGSSTRRPGRPGVLAAAVVGLLAPLVLVAPASASATANEVVYVADDDNDGIYAIVLRDLESRRATTVLPADTAQGWLYDDPELSPDGTQVVFQTDRGNAAGQVGTGLAVVRRDGTGFRRLTAPPESQTVLGADLAPAWSPDGRTVLFSRLVTEDQPDGSSRETSTLYTVPATATTGTAPTAVPGGAGGLTADWSPDGRSIVFTQWDPADATNGRRGTGPLVVMGVDGSGRRVLGASAVGVLPRWSPDGGLIAYTEVTGNETVRDRGDYVTQIATVPAAGGSRTLFASTRPTGARTAAEYPAWTPDGEAIVFDLYGYDSSGNPQPGDLWAVDRSGTRAGQVTGGRGDELQAHVHGPRPAPVVKPAGQTGTRYVPVTPRRVLDTREGIGAPAEKVGAAGTVSLRVHGLETGQGPVPASAAAVVLNVTVTAATANTDVRVYPSGSGVPGASNLNASRGQTVPNLVTATIGSDGNVVLRNSGGTVHLIADLAGYYVPGTAGAGFTAVAPARIGDTRRGHGLVSNKVGPGGVADLQVTGTLRDIDGRTVTVPDDATAVVLNVTATGPTSSTDVRVYPTPADGAVPEVSNLNLRAGETAPNLVTVAVGQGGKVRLRNEGGSVDLIADLAGYYSPGSTGLFVPVVPARFLDTRSGVAAAPIPVTAEASVDPRVAGVRDVPAGATAAVINLTGTGVSATTDVRAYPAGSSTVPTVSNLNLTRGATRANLAIVRTGTDGRIRIRNAAGQVNLIGDLAGYFTG